MLKYGSDALFEELIKNVLNDDNFVFIFRDQKGLEQYSLYRRKLVVSFDLNEFYIQMINNEANSILYLLTENKPTQRTNINNPRNNIHNCVLREFTVCHKKTSINKITGNKTFMSFKWDSNKITNTVCIQVSPDGKFLYTGHSDML